MYTVRTIVLFLVVLSTSFVYAAGNTPSSVQLSNVPALSSYGESVTLVATISPQVATGTVSFYDGPAILGSAPLKGGQAAFQTILLAPGNHLLKATYSGDITYGVSTTASVAQLVSAVPDGGFSTPPIAFGTFSAPQQVLIGDFNGDGKADFAVSNASGVAILLGDGDGTFQQTEELSVASVPLGIAVADFNGDGNTDIVVTTQNDGLSVLLGNGDGTFQTANSYAFQSSSVGFIAVGDFNEDGKADVAIVDGADSAIEILLGNGDGTFEAAVRYAVGNAPSQVVVSDFNGDGHADLAVANTNGGNLSILVGNGNGTFQLAADYPAGSQPSFISVGDFNSDGKPDLAVANRNASVSILFGNGDGTFRTATGLAVGQEPISLVSMDFDGDGKTDLAIADFGVGDVIVLLGNGDGTFKTPVNLPAGTNPSSLAVGDFNGDGRPDFAVTDYGAQGVGVLLGVPKTTDVCLATVNTSSLDVPASGGSVTVSVQTGATCAWVVTGLPSWLTVSGPATGTGSTSSITLVAAPNSGAVREAQVYVAHFMFTVTQISPVLSVNSAV